MHASSQSLTLVLDADPNNPQAVAYAKAINKNMQSLDNGGDTQQLVDLPPLDDPNAVHFSFGDRNGHNHFKELRRKIDGCAANAAAGRTFKLICLKHIAALTMPTNRR